MRQMATRSRSKLIRAWTEPAGEARWIVEQIQSHELAIFLRGALTEDLSRELLELLSRVNTRLRAELVVQDATKLFCHAAVLQRLERAGLSVRVANPIRVLALTINPFTPEYACTSAELIETLLQGASHSALPPIIDVFSGLHV